MFKNNQALRAKPTGDWPSASVVILRPCEVCNITSFQHPHLSKTPLHSEIANKMVTKEIMRKPSIQPLNKANVKPPIVPYHNRLGGHKAGGWGRLEGPLLNRALKRGYPFSDCSPWGLRIVPPFLTNTHVINRGLTQHWA